MHDPHGADQVRRACDPSHPPTRQAEHLGGGAQCNCALPHALHLSQLDVPGVAGEHLPLIRLIRDHDDVMLPGLPCNDVQLLLVHDMPGWVVRRVDNQHLCLLRAQGSIQRSFIYPKVVLFVQCQRLWYCAGHPGTGGIPREVGLEKDTLVIRVQKRLQTRVDALRGRRSHQHLLLGVQILPPQPLVQRCDLRAQRGQARDGGVLVEQCLVGVLKGGDCRLSGNG
mmetsp:Transcript_12609/g.31843  ORF Transcript_12609/g.31843 Transcript_12609/m.31843 type:complete len:225 (-) Transcript_12609:465-1139(-)